jgi:hypothetical protein
LSTARRESRALLEEACLGLIGMFGCCPFMSTWLLLLRGALPWLRQQKTPHRQTGARTSHDVDGRRCLMAHLRAIHMWSAFALTGGGLRSPYLIQEACQFLPGQKVLLNQWFEYNDEKLCRKKLLKICA